MGQVDQHQASTVSSPVPGDPLASATVRATQNDIANAYNAHDADAGIHFNSGLLSGRPAASAMTQGLYLAIDELVLYYSTGLSWLPLAYSSGAPVPNESDMLFLYYTLR